MKIIYAFLFISLLFSCNTENKIKDTSDDSKGKSITSIVLKINGMTCTGCENTISAAVGNLEGVKEVKASFTDSSATVLFDPELVSIDTISQKINDLDYIVIGKVTNENVTE